jgi:hypothetical protein
MRARSGDLQLSVLQLISGIVPTREGEIGRTLVEILTSLIIFRRIIFIKFIHASKEIIVFDKVGYKD